jgi:HSP20 family protein
VARIYFERRELSTLRELDHLSDEAQRFLAWLDDPHSGAVAAECRPPMDVIETREAIEIVADLPGLSTDAVRVVFSRDAVIVAGQKSAPTCDSRGAAFHLAERTFGRFAIVVRLGVAVDAGQARATLRAGELHITLPRIEDRRGRDLQIRIESA